MNPALQILTKIDSFIDAILSFMRLAEDAFPEPGSGQTKKQYVLNALMNVIKNDDIWKYGEKVFSALIDLLAIFHFKK